MGCPRLVRRRSTRLTPFSVQHDATRAASPSVSDWRQQFAPVDASRSKSDGRQFTTLDCSRQRRRLRQPSLAMPLVVRNLCGPGQRALVSYAWNLKTSPTSQELPRVGSTRLRAHSCLDTALAVSRQADPFCLGRARVSCVRRQLDPTAADPWFFGLRCRLQSGTPGRLQNVQDVSSLPSPARRDHATSPRIAVDRRRSPQRQQAPPGESWAARTHRSDDLPWRPRTPPRPPAIARSWTMSQTERRIR